ncbi:MAG: hypothetical protein RR048_01430 [Oscillospiraceae bacterium]
MRKSTIISLIALGTAAVGLLVACAAYFSKKHCVVCDDMDDDFYYDDLDSDDEYFEADIDGEDDCDCYCDGDCDCECCDDDSIIDDAVVEELDDETDEI